VPLSIKNPEIERLARAIARESGESLTDAIGTALQERFQRLRRHRNSRLRDERIQEILAPTRWRNFLDEPPLAKGTYFCQCDIDVLG